MVQNSLSDPSGPEWPKIAQVTQKDRSHNDPLFPSHPKRTRMAQNSQSDPARPKIVASRSKEKQTDRSIPMLVCCSAAVLRMSFKRKKASMQHSRLIFLYLGLSDERVSQLIDLLNVGQMAFGLVVEQLKNG